MMGPPPLVPDASAPDEATMKLAAYLHLEWCADCADWRPLGHSETEKEKRAATAARLQEEEQTYPTIG